MPIPSRRALSAIEARRATIELDGSVVRVQDTAQDVHQRGLAGSVLAQHRVDGAAVELKIDAVVGNEVSVSLRYSSYPDGHRVVPPRGSVPPRHRSSSSMSRCSRLLGDHSLDVPVPLDKEERYRQLLAFLDHNLAVGVVIGPTNGLSCPGTKAANDSSVSVLTSSGTFGPHGLRGKSLSAGRSRSSRVGFHVPSSISLRS